MATNNKRPLNGGRKCPYCQAESVNVDRQASCVSFTCTTCGKGWVKEITSIGKG